MNPVKTLALVTMLLAMLASNTGCFWLAVGGAGAAGYELAKDDRSFGTKVDDASVTTRVKSLLARDSRVNALDINVDTFAGAVTLHGHVPSQGVANHAVELARSVKGVRFVNSKLRIVSR
jgi:hyperosmotically inducible protein